LRVSNREKKKWKWCKLEKQAMRNWQKNILIVYEMDVLDTVIPQNRINFTRPGFANSKTLVAI
jgi:hypothetical protein